jgi:hypothetical protein
MQTRLRIGIAMVVLAVLATAAAAARMDDSLAAPRAQPDPGERFAFVVVSDMHSAARLAPAKLAAGARIGYNLVVNDKDGPVAGQRHWWVELLPGAGSGSAPFPLVRLELR